VTGVLLCVAAGIALWPSGEGAAGRIAGSGRRGPSARRPLPSSPLAAGVAAALLAALVSTPLVAVLAAGCVGLAVRGLRRRRWTAAADTGLLALAEALGVLAAELDAGRALASATAAAVSACPDEATGRALAEALRPDGAQRPATAELQQVGAAVRLSVRTGSSLAAVIRALEEDLRARHRLQQELRTATAGPRASAAVLAGLPVLGLLMGSGVGARPWSVLTTTAAGQVLLVVGVVLEGAGVAWTGRLARRAAPELSTGPPRRAR
jgi:tight adherence protein B